jgi:hypothetical protein
MRKNQVCREFTVHLRSNARFYMLFCFGLREHLGPLKGQSHEKVGEMSVWGIGLGPN